MYASDNNGVLVENCGYQWPEWNAGHCWVMGNLQVMPDMTNLVPIITGKLYPYNRNYHIYKCPADTQCYLNNVLVTRYVDVKVRSYSISGQMNSGDNHINDVEFPNIKKESEIVCPPPSRALVFDDEAACTIDDGFLAELVFENEWANMPAARHDKGVTFSFADGHVEYWRWLDPRTVALANGAIISEGGSTTLCPHDWPRFAATWAASNLWSR